MIPLSNWPHRVTWLRVVSLMITVLLIHSNCFVVLRKNSYLCFQGTMRRNLSYAKHMMYKRVFGRRFVRSIRLEQSFLQCQYRNQEFWFSEGNFLMDSEQQILKNLTWKPTSSKCFHLSFQNRDQDLLLVSKRRKERSFSVEATVAALLGNLIV